MNGATFIVFARERAAVDVRARVRAPVHRRARATMAEREELEPGSAE